MEFIIPEHLIEDHFGNRDKILNPHMYDKDSKKALRKVKEYFKSKDIEFFYRTQGIWKDHSECYHYAIDYMKLKFPLGTEEENTDKFTDYVKNAFDEINSLENISCGQLVAYYYDESEFLHAGVIEKIVNGKPRVISQWGETGIYNHPIDIVDLQYGNKYKIFNRNPQKNKEYLRKDNLEFIREQKEYGEIKKSIKEN